MHCSTLKQWEGCNFSHYSIVVEKKPSYLKKIGYNIVTALIYKKVHQQLGKT